MWEHTQEMIADITRLQHTNKWLRSKHCRAGRHTGLLMSSKDPAVPLPSHDLEQGAGGSSQAGVAQELGGATTATHPLVLRPWYMEFSSKFQAY